MDVEVANVIVVNWKDAVDKSLEYIFATDNVRICGSDIGDFIKKIGIDPMKTHCIGHSLGAHVCGFAGKTIKLGRISGEFNLKIWKKFI